jgi:hypothetical protein
LELNYAGLNETGSSQIVLVSRTETPRGQQEHSRFPDITAFKNQYKKQANAQNALYILYIST